jgi:small-conductance mechanosensitive channel
MDIQQHINLTLLNEFRQREISIAFPARTLHFPPGLFRADNAGSEGGPENNMGSYRTARS